MNLYVLLGGGVALTVVFHFLGVYANAKKVVWIMLALVWAGAISFALQEISPKGYEHIDEIRGKNPETDRLIEAALPEISIYEMLAIQKSFEAQPQQ